MKIRSFNFIYKTYRLKRVILVQGTGTGVSLLHRLFVFFVFFVVGVLQQTIQFQCYVTNCSNSGGIFFSKTCSDKCSSLSVGGALSFLCFFSFLFALPGKCIDAIGGISGGGGSVGTAPGVNGCQSQAWTHCPTG